MKPIVAHYNSSFLPLSETFIYEYVTKLEKYQAIVLAKVRENPDCFPFKDLYLLSDRPQFPRWRFWPEFIGRILKRSFATAFFEQVMKGSQARLIHAHFGPRGVEMLPLKRRLCLPLVTTFYGQDLSVYPRHKYWRKAYQKLFMEGTLFLVEGSFMKKGLIALGCPPEKIRIQHMAVDIYKFTYQERTPERDEKVRILFCGRFVEKKGLLGALQAVKIAAENIGNLEFRIIGDGELRPKVENYIQGNEMNRYVVLLGYQSHEQYRQELLKAHILLQPSITASDGDSEGGAPTVLLEAQATGLPVVSTIHADIPEVVLDGITGFLVPQRDPKALAVKIQDLIRHPRLHVELGKAGRRHIEENYNIYTEIKKLEVIYDGLL